MNAIVILYSGKRVLRNSEEAIFPSELLRKTVDSMTTEKHEKTRVIIPEKSQTQLARNDWRE